MTLRLGAFLRRTNPKHAQLVHSPALVPRMCFRRQPRWAILCGSQPWQVAVTWATVVLALLIRLAGGWVILPARLRPGAAPDARRIGRVVSKNAAKAIGLSRYVTLAAHPAVASPVVIGGMRPIILVPSDWDHWPEPHRRACPLHELGPPGAV